jgi:hypothetical protein
MARPNPARYQLRTYNELRELAADYFDYNWQSLPITPRTNVLICAASGTGKTFLSEMLARELRLPLLRLEFANWIVVGARSRGALQTLQLLYRFIDRYPKGIIAIDEIDKLGTDSTSEWTRAVHCELFSVLDRRILPGIIEGAEQSDDSTPFAFRPEDIALKFAREFLVIGSGAWQDTWRGPIVSGFSSTSECNVTPTYAELLQSIRPEIRNRFRSEILYLGPLTRADYESLIEEAVDRLPAEFAPLMRKAAAISLDEALETQKGYRWIEELVTAAIRILRVSKAQKLPFELCGTRQQG